MYNQDNSLLHFPQLRELMKMHGFTQLEQIYKDGRLVATYYMLTDPEIAREIRYRRLAVSNGCFVRYFDYGKGYSTNRSGFGYVSAQFFYLYYLYHTGSCARAENPLFATRPLKVLPYSQYTLEKWTGQMTMELSGPFEKNSNYLIQLAAGKLNIYATQTNVVYRMDETKFPYGAKYYYAQKKLQINEDLNRHFKFIINKFGDVENIAGAISAMKADRAIPLSGFAAYFSEEKRTALPDASKACASYLCFICPQDMLEEAAYWALQTFGLLPNVYLETNNGMLPDFVPLAGKYIPFAEFEDTLSPYGEICTETTARGLKVFSWNTVNYSTTAYEGPLSFDFPFMYWKCYKHAKLLETILRVDADVCCFSEAQSVVELYRSQSVLAEKYEMVAEGIGNIALPPGTNYFSVILVSKRCKVVHAENFAFARISYDIPLARSLGIKEPVTLDRLKSFDKFNTVSFAVVEMHGERVAVASVYATWQFVYAPIKYFYLKYTFRRCDELAKQFSCAGTLVCGDYNIKPVGSIYKSFYQTVSAAEADYYVEFVISESEAERRLAEQDPVDYKYRLTFAKYCDTLRIEAGNSVFTYQPNYDVAALFRGDTPRVASLETDQLDYHFTTLPVLEKCPIYNDAEFLHMPNKYCVSDHNPLICVLKLGKNEGCELVE